jgi:hypothetical protein
MVSTKLSTFAVLTFLIISVMVCPLSSGFAQDTGEDNGQQVATESLLRILERSRERVNASFEILVERGVNVSDAARLSYSEGVEMVATALQLRDAGEYKQAREMALQAMEKFREAFLEIAEEMEETETSEEKEAVRATVQTAARNRAQLYIERLNNLADRAEELGYNVTEIRETLAKAHGYITNATSLADAGGEVGKAISTAAKTMGQLQPIVKANKAKQAQKFLEKAEERLTNLEGKMEKLSSQVPTQAQQALNQTMERARNRVEEARKLMQAGDIDDAIGAFREMNRNMEQGIQTFGDTKPDTAQNLAILDKLEAKIIALEDKLATLELEGFNVTQITSRLNEAKNLLTQATDNLQNQETVKASENIEQADKLIEEVEKFLEQQEQEMEKVREQEQKQQGKRQQMVTGSPKAH